MIDSVRARTLKNAREMAFESRDNTLLLLCCERRWKWGGKGLLTKQGVAYIPLAKNRSGSIPRLVRGRVNRIRTRYTTA